MFDDELLTVAEVAGQLRVDQQTVRNWVSRGELPAIRVGRRRVRIRESDLQRFIESSTARRLPSPDATQQADSGRSPTGAAEPTRKPAARDEFNAALRSVAAITDTAESRELSSALRTLGRAANSLARALDKA